MRRVGAIIGIILLCGCIIATIICAIAGAPGNVLLALLFCDIVIPCIIFGYSKLITLVKRKNNSNENNKTLDTNEITDKKETQKK